MQAGDKTAAELEAELMKLEQMKHTELQAYWSARWTAMALATVSSIC